MSTFSPSDGEVVDPRTRSWSGTRRAPSEILSIGENGNRLISESTFETAE